MASDIEKNTDCDLQKGIDYDMENDIDCGAGQLAIRQEQYKEKLYESLMKRTAIIATIFTVISVVFMIIYLNLRSVQLDDTVKAGSYDTAIDDAKYIDDSFSVSVTGDEDNISLNLPAGTNSNDIVIENHVTSCQLFIKVADSSDFYTEDMVVSTPSNVTGCMVTSRSDSSSCLYFQLDGIYEYTSTLDDSTLSITLVDPHKMYDKIMVIDPVYSDNDAGDTEDIALYESQSLMDKLEEDDIKVYLLRTDSSDISLADKKAFIKALSPDFVICIDADADTNVYYNDKLYLRSYGNDDLASQVLADISYEIAGEGHIDVINALSISLRPYDLMMSLDVPAVLVTLPKPSVTSGDYISSSLDYSYQDKIVTGLYKAVLYAYMDLGTVKNN